LVLVIFVMFGLRHFKEKVERKNTNYLIELSILVYLQIAFVYIIIFCVNRFKKSC